MKGKYVENKFNKLKYVVKHIILNLKLFVQCEHTVYYSEPENRVIERWHYNNTLWQVFDVTKQYSFTEHLLNH